MLLANFIALVCAVLMAGFAAWAVGAVPRDARWPMQWGVSGKVNWRASRTMALAVSLGVSGSVLGLAARSTNDADQPGTLIAVSLISAVVVCGYFIAAVRDIRSGPT